MQHLEYSVVTNLYKIYKSFEKISKQKKVKTNKDLQVLQAYKICSKELLDSEVENIKDILIKNGYPEFWSRGL